MMRYRYPLRYAHKHALHQTEYPCNQCGSSQNERTPNECFLLRQTSSLLSPHRIFLRPYAIPNVYANRTTQIMNSTIITSCKIIFITVLVNSPTTDPNPTFDALEGEEPPISSPIKAPMNGPNTSPKAGITNGPIMTPMVLSVVDSLEPPNF